MTTTNDDLSSRLRFLADTCPVGGHMDLELRNAAEEIERLRAALAEAMSVRHFCDMESDPESDAAQPQHPYHYDKYLQNWSVALGARVYSAWPKPGTYRVVKL